MDILATYFNNNNMETTNPMREPPDINLIGDHPGAAAAMIALRAEVSGSTDAATGDDADADADARAFLASDDTIYRYLFACRRKNQWKMANSAKMLRATLAWRRKLRPWAARCPKCPAIPGFHPMRMVGFDAAGRVLFYTCFAQAHRDHFTNSRDHLLFSFEQAAKTFRATAPYASRKWVYICDFAGYGWRDNKMGPTRELVHIMSAHYPERLAYFLCVNAPGIFRFFYKALKPFVDPRTYEKVRWCAGEKEVASKAAELFPPGLARWLTEEVALNRTRTLPPSQVRYWEAPANDGEHDARGEASYLARYVDEQHPCGHLPHQNYARGPIPAQAAAAPDNGVAPDAAATPAAAAAAAEK